MAWSHLMLHNPTIEHDQAPTFREQIGVAIIIHMVGPQCPTTLLRPVRIVQVDYRGDPASAERVALQPRIQSNWSGNPINRQKLNRISVRSVEATIFFVPGQLHPRRNHKRLLLPLARPRQLIRHATNQPLHMAQSCLGPRYITFSYIAYFICPDTRHVVRVRLESSLSIHLGNVPLRLLQLGGTQHIVDDNNLPLLHTLHGICRKFSFDGIVDSLFAGSGVQQRSAAGVPCMHHCAAIPHEGQPSHEGPIDPAFHSRLRGCTGRHLCRASPGIGPQHT
mmetsp:Transcript_2384/g.5297  ORF Transcript_2384/g.5297 Transcript_2384/m.5297 type:complete len:279 (-) Transcript_2384:28-864(-)